MNSLQLDRASWLDTMAAVFPAAQSDIALADFAYMAKTAVPLAVIRRLAHQGGRYSWSLESHTYC